ncbi:5-formyltetrahydrofolate cyclo-ligase [bacterium]|nr:5-formyltetrahydrofolate cyclo-ligase [bacterium]
MRAARKALTTEIRSSETRRVLERIMESLSYQRAGVVVSYMALGSELDLAELNGKVLAEGKKLVLPVVAGKDLIFREVGGLTEEYFKVGSFGIREPREELPLWNPMEERFNTLWLLPGVAFDRDCRRLGQGGGYYDRTLERLRTLRRAGDTIAGVAFDCQIADRIPTEEWDASLDVVITPGETYINHHI